LLYKSLIKPLLFRLDAERAHDLAGTLGRKTGNSVALAALAKSLYNYQSPLLQQTRWGIPFRNPVGLAAGFDKNGHLPKAMQALGMGFTEIGSITAQARGGNPKPRAFRLSKDRALINRMGLNNDGAETIVQRLQNTDSGIPVGINIAKTHDPEIMGDAAIKDYAFSYQEACKVADYITVNISCPNTAEGKTFEEAGVLDELLSALLDQDSDNDGNNNSIISKSDDDSGKNYNDSGWAVPTLVKFSSDLEKDSLQALLKVCERHGVNGYVACNTSSSRRGLDTDPAMLESIGSGGLSGAPLASKSVRTVRWIRELIGEDKPVIGVGGIDSFAAALAMLKAGANLLQVYTGLVYEGPALVKNINRKLARYLEDNGLRSLNDL
jgi:dihydroorotate dehydrogenase